MGAVLNHWINYSVWICTAAAAALRSDRRDTRPEWTLQWELLGTTRLSLRLWGTEIFYHSGPWTLAEDVSLLVPWGRDSSELGWDCHWGRQRALSTRDCACVQCSCPRGSGRELNSARQRHLWEDAFALMLLTQNDLRGMITFSENFSSSELTGLSASRYSQTLIRFFFKCSDNLKIWWSHRIFKWTFNGCQLFNF